VWTLLSDLRRRKLKQLQSLEVCGGGLTDAGVVHLRELTQLRSLSLAQVNQSIWMRKSQMSWGY